MKDRRRFNSRAWSISTLSLLAVAALFVTACTDDDPTETNLDAGFQDLADRDGGDAGAGDAETADGDAADGETSVSDADVSGGDAADSAETGDAGDAGDANGGDVDPAACVVIATDFSPGADDEWPECITDDNAYHRFEESISSIGRIAGFEEIVGLLLASGGPPTPADFVSARDIYATGEGLDSRLQRREDEHYPAVTDPDTGETLRCRDEGVPEMDRDRCVGPAQMLPILNDAFRLGIEGNQPELQAARIEATLLWFLYVSTYKEAVTCTVKKKDCDSSYAYYGGGEDREGGLGLARYIRTVSPEAHDRVWDGILAVRCWRDLDNGEEATDLALRDRALAQLDRALLYGLTQVIADRLLVLQVGNDTERVAARAFIEILGPVLQREASERAPELAAELATSWEAGDDRIDVGRTIELMAEIFPCP